MYWLSLFWVVFRCQYLSWGKRVFRCHCFRSCYSSLSCLGCWYRNAIVLCIIMCLSYSREFHIRISDSWFWGVTYRRKKWPSHYSTQTLEWCTPCLYIWITIEQHICCVEKRAIKNITEICTMQKWVLPLEGNAVGLLYGCLSHFWVKTQKQTSSHVWV